MPRVGRRPRRRLLRVIVVAELVVALLTGAGVAFAYQHVNGRIDTGPSIVHPPEVTREPKTPTGALNILVMGTDARDCADCGIDSEGGLGGSDLTILLHVAEGRRSAYGISIPRDTLVDRPACTKDGRTVPAASEVMWNDALAVGGPTCTVAQLEALTGIYVDDYIVVDFGGFKDMVDAVGGVEVCIPRAIDDTEHHIHLDAGTQVLRGKQSLAYVRQRTSTPNADLGRMKRQQAFIASMLGRLMTAQMLTRPDRLLDFASAVAGSITTNPELASVADLTQLGRSLRNANLDRIRFVTAPTTDFPRTDPRWGRLQLTPDAEELWRRVKTDRPLGTFGQGAITGRKPSGGSKQQAAANGLCS